MWSIFRFMFSILIKESIMKELIKDVSDFAVLFCGIATLLILFAVTMGACLLPVFIGMWMQEIVGNGLAISSMIMMYCVYYVSAKRMGWIEKYMMEVLNG